MLRAGGVVLLLVCGFSLLLFLRRVFVRGFRRFVTHDPKSKVHDKRRQPGRRSVSGCGNCRRANKVSGAIARTQVKNRPVSSLTLFDTPIRQPASPADGHFDRNKIHAISGTGHYSPGMSSLIAKVVSVQNDARELSARVVEIVTDGVPITVGDRLCVNIFRKEPIN